MAFSYPEFHGRVEENIEDFLESMEVACISNHVEAPAQMLQLLQICLKGDARAWSRSYEQGLQGAKPPIQLTWNNLQQALAIQFAKVEDLDKVWHKVLEAPAWIPKLLPVVIVVRCTSVEHHAVDS